MNLRRKIYLSAILLLLVFQAAVVQKLHAAQSDSSKFYLIDQFQNTALPDTIRILNMADYLSFLYQSGIEDNKLQSDSLIDQLIQLASKSGKYDFLVRLSGRRGVQKRNEFAMSEAIFWHKIQKRVAKLSGNYEQYVSGLNNTGLIYRRMDKYELAISAYQRAIKIADSIGYSRGAMFATNGLGNIFLEMGSLSEAMKNFRECLRLEQAANNMTGVAINLNNIGHVYNKYGDHEKALEYFLLSLDINREISSQRGMAICYNDIGDIFMKRGETDKAHNYYLMSHQLNTAINDIYYLGINNLRLAEIHMAKRDFSKAKNYLEEAIRLSAKTANRSNLMNAYKLMYEIHRKTGNIESAIVFLERATTLNDSILNESIQRTLFQMQATFNRERADNQIELLQNEKQIADLRIKRQQTYNVIIIAGLLLLLSALMVLLFVLRFKAKANRMLLEKNHEIENARIQLSEYAEKLLVAKQEAEQSSRLKSQFLANMSHEIRTPLNSVIGFAEILAAKTPDQQMHHYLEIIQLNGKSLLMLIEDILDLSKIEAGKLEPVLAPMNALAIMDEIKRMFSYECESRNIELIVEVDNSFPSAVMMHEGSFRQILLNLTGNAIKFTQEGSIHVKLSADFSSDDRVDVVLIVEDTGIGMEKEDLEHIFEAFYQAHNAKNMHRGTGLGLAITHRLVEMLNGTIGVVSEKGQGTRFQVYFKDVHVQGYRSSLRFPGLKTEDTAHPTMALVTKSNQLKTIVDEVLRKLHLVSDVYDRDFDLKNYFPKIDYEIVLWDASYPESQSEFRSLLKVNQTNILLIYGLMHESNAVQYFGKVFHIPEQLDEFTGYLKGNQSTSAKELSAEIPKDHPDFSIYDKDSFNKLMQLFIKAHQGQIIQDIGHFAVELRNFGRIHQSKRLQHLGALLISEVESFDIERINRTMNEFKTLVGTYDKLD